MSGSEQEGKGEAKMVSIPLSSDDETSLGQYLYLKEVEIFQASCKTFHPSF